MSNPKDRIRAGLDARKREKSGGSFTLSNLVGAPTTIADLSTLANQASMKRDRLRAFADGVTAAIEMHKAQKTAELAELGRERTENGLITDTLGENRRRAMTHRALDILTLSFSSIIP